MPKSTFETKLAWAMFSWFGAIALFLIFHWTMDYMGEDSAPVWVCETMGNGQCGPGEPWIRINQGD